MAVEHPWWKKALCYVFCEWFTKPVFKKRLCVCAYDILNIKKKVERGLKEKDGGFRFLRVPKIIAFIGLDGSGKSTQAKNIIEFLKKNKFKIKYLHLPSAVPLNLVIKASKVKVSSTKKTGILSSFFRQCAFLTGLPWIYLFKILPNTLRGRIIIADRWFYDELVHLTYRKQCFFPDLYRKLIIKPGLLIYLDVKPEIAQKRKPEQDVDYFILKHELYNKLAAKIKAKKIKSIQLNKTKASVEKILKQRLKYALD